MSITSDIIRGHTETIILSHLTEKDSYGYEINKSIQEKTNNKYELKEATLYSAFRRLEQSSLIISYWGDETTGARRRYYSITPLGREALKQNISDWKEAKELIDSLISGGNEYVSQAE
ncbi:PadR family transcriptional regulator [Clostridium cellulovorans]|uniref:Transcriptional regulator, PadR-like family n=1 Tax=Clostridium cellulovorans (strain ATCC 35296 / DSM 3052 / OCM 3 / 743B) TaxID=573061 RepID=D9SWZ3_CLOC7|nr:PadR family transcriptional regulator [Clostridium cellulovorans]ADL51354.1 transcriptional regulator, PadR-like family [Clostridium cellulovorans 743B]